MPTKSGERAVQKGKFPGVGTSFAGEAGRLPRLDGCTNARSAIQDLVHGAGQVFCQLPVFVRRHLVRSRTVLDGAGAGPFVVIPGEGLLDSACPARGYRPSCVRGPYDVGYLSPRLGNGEDGFCHGEVVVELMGNDGLAVRCFIHEDDQEIGLADQLKRLGVGEIAVGDDLAGEALPLDETHCLARYVSGHVECRVHAPLCAEALHGEEEFAPGEALLVEISHVADGEPPGFPWVLPPSRSGRDERFGPIVPVRDNRDPAGLYAEERPVDTPVPARIRDNMVALLVDRPFERLHDPVVERGGGAVDDLLDRPKVLKIGDPRYAGEPLEEKPDDVGALGGEEVMTTSMPSSFIEPVAPPQRRGEPRDEEVGYEKEALEVYRQGPGVKSFENTRKGDL